MLLGVSRESSRPLSTANSASRYRLDTNFLLSTTTTPKSQHISYPSPESINILWKHYVSNVDSLVKILHKPTVDSMIQTCSRGREREIIASSTDALLFAICFAAVVTMSIEECSRLLGEERETLMLKYRYGLEQALASAGWMTSQELVVLQALVLLLVCLARTLSRTT